MVITCAIYTALFDSKNRWGFSSCVRYIGFVFSLVGIEGDYNPSVVSIIAIYG